VSEKISKKHKAFNLLQNNNGEPSKKIAMINNLSHGVVQKSNSPSITTKNFSKENQISISSLLAFVFNIVDFV